MFGEQSLGLLGPNTGMDNNVLALLPVYWRSDAVLVAELDRVDDANDLVLSSVSG